jgi:hypothetical protein
MKVIVFPQWDVNLFLTPALENAEESPAIAENFCSPSNNISEILTAFTVTSSRSRAKKVFWYESGAPPTSHYSTSVDICG